MRPFSFREEIQRRIEAGESLVSLDQVPALKSLSSSTRANMVADGRLPAIRNGRRFLTLVSLVNERLVESVVEPDPGKAKNDRHPRAQLVGKGLAKLKAMGFKPAK